MIEGNDLIALIACLFAGTIVSGVLLGKSDGRRDALWIYAVLLGAFISSLWTFVVVGSGHNMLRVVEQLDGKEYSWRAVQTEMLCVLAAVLAIGLYILSVRVTRSLRQMPSSKIIPMS